MKQTCCIHVEERLMNGGGEQRGIWHVFRQLWIRFRISLFAFCSIFLSFYNLFFSRKMLTMASTLNTVWYFFFFCQEKKLVASLDIILLIFLFTNTSECILSILSTVSYFCPRLTMYSIILVRLLLWRNLLATKTKQIHLFVRFKSVPFRFADKF